MKRYRIQVPELGQTAEVEASRVAVAVNRGLDRLLKYEPTAKFRIFVEPLGKVAFEYVLNADVKYPDGTTKKERLSAGPYATLKDAAKAAEILRLQPEYGFVREVRVRKGQ